MQRLSEAISEDRGGLVAAVRTNPSPHCVVQHPPLRAAATTRTRGDGAAPPSLAVGSSRAEPLPNQSETPSFSGGGAETLSPSPSTQSPEPRHHADDRAASTTAMRLLTTRNVDSDQSCPPAPQLVEQSHRTVVASDRVSTFPLIDVAALVQGAARHQPRTGSSATASPRTEQRKHSAPLPMLRMDEVSKDTFRVLLSPNLQRGGGVPRRPTPGAGAGWRSTIGAGAGSTLASRSASTTSTAALSAMALDDPDCEIIAVRDGGDEGMNSQRPPTAVAFSGVGVSAMSASIEKDLMMTENIVRRLVDEYVANRRCKSSSSRRTGRNGGGAAFPDDRPDGDGSTGCVHLDDMFTASVMGVSKTFEAVVGQLEGGHAAALHQRQQRLNALAAPHHTRIPKKYWITRDPMPTLATTSAPASRTTTTANAQQRSTNDAFQIMHDGNKVLAFPSPTPGNRPEVYLLARTLDELLADTVPNRSVLTDPSVAYAILPNDLTLRHVSATEAVRQQYVQVARAFFDVLDVGLSEVARQVAPSCPERASVIDRIRQAFHDVHGTCFDIVAHCKERAFEEALRRQEYDDTITTKNRQIIDGLAKVAALESRVLELEKEIETNATKAIRFDELISRMDVREQQRQRAIIRADQLESLDDADDAVSKASLLANAVFEDLSSSNAAQRPVESTAARLERLRREEEEQGQVALYDASVRLMKTLRETVAATDAACEPFYNRMLFGTPELNASVAAGKWSAIGKAIGEHEALWDHRERVARAHAIWLEVMTTKANARSRRGGGGATNNNNNNISAIGSANQQRNRIGSAGSDVASDDDDVQTGGPKAPSSAANNTSLLQFECDVDQLRAMGVTDVTPDEIMMMQHPDFDVQSFLHPSQRIPTRWGMNSSGVAQMLVDVQTTFQEVSVRLNALKESGLLADIARPPLMPPQHPADPCGLCGRRDGVELEKRQHRDFVDKVVKEMHAREADALARVEEAREERDAVQSQLDAQMETCRKLEQRLDMLETLRPNAVGNDEDHPTSLSSHGTLIAPSELPPSAASKPLAAPILPQAHDAAVADSSSRSGGHSEEGKEVDAPATRRQTSTVRRRSSITSRSSASNTPSLSASATPAASGLKVKSGGGSVNSGSAAGRKASASPHQPQEGEYSNEGSSSHSEHHALSGSRRNSRVTRRKSSGTLSRSRGGSTTPGKQALALRGSLTASEGGGKRMDSATEEHHGSPSASLPLVIKLEINCRCCHPLAASTSGGGDALPQKQHSASSLLEAPTVVTEGGTAAPVTHLSTFDMLMNYKIPDENLVVDGSAASPSAMRSIPSAIMSPPRRPGTVEPARPKDTPMDAGGPVGNVTPNFEDFNSEFALAPPRLASFVDAPDPVVSHTKSMRRLVAVNSTATLRPTRASSAAKAVGGNSDTFGENSSYSPFGGSTRNATPLDLDLDDAPSQLGAGASVPPDPSAEVGGHHRVSPEGNTKRRSSIASDVALVDTAVDDVSTLLVERITKKEDGAWSHMEDKVMHRLKSIEVSRIMAATVRPREMDVPPGAPANPPAPLAARQSKAPNPPSSARSGTLRLGLTQRHQGAASARPRSNVSNVADNSASNTNADAGVGKPPIPHDPVALLSISSGAALRQIVSASEDDRIDAAFKTAVQALRHAILQLSGRIETLQRPSVRTLGWLLKYIGNFYRAKRQADATAEHEGRAYATAQAFLATFLKRQLGASEIVYEHLHYIYASCKAHRDVDLRVKQFMRVLFLYDVRTTSFFLQVSLLLEQCGVGLDYSASHNHFTMDDAAGVLECMCFRRVAACLTESGLHHRRYAQLLWKALSHRSFAAPVTDDAFYGSLRKAGMEAEAVQRRPPSTWSAEDTGMMRVVVLKSAFLALLSHLEMADAGGGAPGAPDEAPSDNAITGRGDRGNRSTRNARNSVGGTGGTTGGGGAVVLTTTSLPQEDNGSNDRLTHVM